MDSGHFDYNEAFSRNLGLVTRDEQAILRSKRIAIAGMGGVGGIHLLTLARLGIGHFTIADMDVFEIPNFNRQAGASMSTLGEPKAETMRKAALDINPECDIRVFADGITEENMDDFLDGVDIYLDGLDFFVLDIREKIFTRCAERGIPVVTAGPIGHGTAWTIFDPSGMGFEEYFRFKGQDDIGKAIHFLIGVAPGLLHKNHIVDHERINFAQKQVASLSVGCQAASAVAASEILKILLGRGKVKYAPWVHQFDIYNNRFKSKYNFMGNANPLSRLKAGIVRKHVLGKRAFTKMETIYQRDLERILDMARWAPSGDNCQPWFITIESDTRFSLDLTKFKKNVYNLTPEPDFLTTGAFLGTARIAAEAFGYDLVWQLDGTDKVVAEIVKSEGRGGENPLSPYIRTRSVNRFRYRLKSLPLQVKKELDALLDEDLKLHWYESLAEKFDVARLLMQTTDIRLRIPETYAIHSHMTDWSGEDSPDRMPARALGINPLGLAMMKWAMANEKRNATLVSLPASTSSFQMELDLLPSIFSAGHFMLTFDPAKTPHPTAEDHIRAGEALQKIWLTLTRHNIVLQPWYIPVGFARYMDRGIAFTEWKKGLEKAEKLRADVYETLLTPHGLTTDHVVFTARVGYPTKTGLPRSVRKPLEDLIVEDKTRI